MPRNPRDLAEEKLTRAKDQTSRLEGQLSDARLHAGRLMLAARDAGAPRTRLAVIWRTSLSQVDRMIARAETERG